MSKLGVNPHLIWDYDFTDAEHETDEFRQWYIGRVLQRGGMLDIQNVGIDNVRTYLPKVHIPSHIRDFWNWYFSLPG